MDPTKLNLGCGDLAKEGYINHDIAKHNDYVMPEINEDDQIRIKDGRHPVVEHLVTNERFIANDTLLDLKANQMIILTGPNMAGKSTYIRQVALITFLAHVGSFVPAKAFEK